MGNRIVIPNKGYFYRNELWFSPAYHSLTNASRDLLQCFLTEIKKKNIKLSKRKEWVIINNGKISFTVLQFKGLCGYSKQTYINARNQLIKNGIIIRTYKGGNCKGDMATYQLLCTDDIKSAEQLWRLYPEKDFTNDIPKSNKKRVGSKTQWKKGECGRKSKSTLSDCTPNKSNHPIVVDPME